MGLRETLNSFIFPKLNFFTELDKHTLSKSHKNYSIRKLLKVQFACIKHIKMRRYMSHRGSEADLCHSLSS